MPGAMTLMATGEDGVTATRKSFADDGDGVMRKYCEFFKNCAKIPQAL
jgi:hypothetical protein